MTKHGLRMIRNIIFDFGKVLICDDYPAFLKTIVADDDERRDFEEIVRSSAFLTRCELGVEPFIDTIRAYQKAYPRWEKALQEFHDRQLEAMTTEMPGMRDLLTRLRANGYRLYGLTNWGDTVYPVMEKYAIFRLLDDRIISYEERLVKPNAAIYDRLCEKFGLKKVECLFTDDKPVNVDGAKAAGMQAVLFMDAQQFEKELNALGVRTR